LTFEEHVEKLKRLALTVHPYYDIFTLYETDESFLISAKLGKEQLGIVEYFRRVDDTATMCVELRDESQETVIASGDCLADIEERLELLLNKG